MQEVTQNVESLSPEDCNIAQIKAKIASGEYKIVPKLGKSRVWEIFGEVEMNGSINKKIVACKCCNTAYKSNNIRFISNISCLLHFE